MLLDALDEADWPTSPQAALARRILPEYLRSGPSSLVANADVVMRLWRADDEILPVTYRAAPPATETADVCSPWNHYVRYPKGEIKRHQSGPKALIGRTLIGLTSPALRLASIDRVVSVNNWLLSTNPMTRLSRADIARLTTELAAEFPDRAIVLRTINPDLDGELAARLVARGYRLVAHRTVYILNPRLRAYARKKNARVDRRLLERGDYIRVEHEQLTAADMPRLAELHHLLYVEKHTELNPQLTRLFFESAWRKRWFHFEGFRRNGRIDAFAAWFDLHGLITSVVVGYDTRVPVAVGLYRRCMALSAEYARARQLPLHWSSGAGAFKHHRGALPCIEYDAVFTEHLPPHRRFGWRMLEAAGWFQQRKVNRGW